MRTNKGYQMDKGKRRGNQECAFPSGNNKTLEQYLAEIDHNFDLRIKAAKKEYEKIAKKTTLVGEELRKYCREWLLWEVKFDDNNNLVPLAQVMNELESYRERCKANRSYDYIKRITNKDNQKFVYNSSGGGDSHHRVRIPSMKRSNATWKRFYELFPYYKEHYGELNNKNGIKLKRVW